MQVYSLASGMIGSVPASEEGLEVTDLVGIATGGYGAVHAKVSSPDGETYFCGLYRFEARPPRISGKDMPGTGGEEDILPVKTFRLWSPFGDPFNTSELAPLGQAFWGSVKITKDGAHLSVFGPRGPFDVPLVADEGSRIQRADVVNLVKSLDGDSRNCRVMVSGIVRTSDVETHREVWLFDTHGKMLQHFRLPYKAEAGGYREVAVCGGYDGFLYVMEAGDGGVRVVRY